MNDNAWQAAEAAAEALAPETGEFASLDSAGLGEAVRTVLLRAAGNPAGLASATMRFWTSMARIGPVAAARWLGAEAAPPVPAEDDKRFADRTWADNPAFFALRQAYLAATQLSRDVLAAGAGDTVADAKAELAAGFVLDALAPTNFLLTNPAALKRALETGGASVAAGARNFTGDLLGNGGRPQPGRHQRIPAGGESGGHAGQGGVQERADGAHSVRAADAQGPGGANAGQPAVDQQVLHHGPGAGPQLHRVGGPARAGRSSPSPTATRTPRCADVTLDDYLVHGPRAALDAIADITGSAKIDIVGLCLGGALTGMLAA